MGIVIQGFSDEPYKLVVKLMGTGMEGDVATVTQRKNVKQTNNKKLDHKHRQV
ncbi:MAG: hypothetical protein ACP5UZ_08490 [Thermoplasmata archaeon]